MTARGPSSEPHLPARGSHLLVEVTDPEVKVVTQRRPARASYTSVAVGSVYVAVGTSAGTIVVYHRARRRQVLLIPASDKDQGIRLLAFSPDNSRLAHGTSSGLVVITELNLSKKSSHPQRIVSTSDHQGATLSGLSWHGDRSRLYASDDTGRVSLVDCSRTKSLLSSTSYVILRLDSSVTQLDVCGDRVLASTLRKAYIANIDRNQFTQIGTKPRDGEFGACFYPLDASSTFPGVAMTPPTSPVTIATPPVTMTTPPVVYCARPGSRLWEADHNGSVLTTHQMKRLMDTAPTPLVHLGADSPMYEGVTSSSPGPQSLSFSLIHRIGPGWLLCVSGTRLCVVDPGEVRVVLWTQYKHEILQVSCHGNSLFVLCHSLHGNTVSQLELMSVPKLVTESLSLNPELCALVVVAMRASLMDTLSEVKPDSFVTTLRELREKLCTLGTYAGSIYDAVEEILGRYSRKDEKQSRVEFTKSESGIFVARRSCSQECWRGSDLVLQRVCGQLSSSSEWGSKSAKMSRSSSRASVDSTDDVERGLPPEDRLFFQIRRDFDGDSERSSLNSVSITSPGDNVFSTSVDFTVGFDERDEENAKSEDSKSESSFGNTLMNLSKSPKDACDDGSNRDSLESSSLDVDDLEDASILSTSDGKTKSRKPKPSTPRITEGMPHVPQTPHQDSTVTENLEKNSPASGNPPTGNPSPKDTILAVKDKVTSTAKTLVQTLREQSSRLTKRDPSSSSLHSELSSITEEGGGKGQDRDLIQLREGADLASGSSDLSVDPTSPFSQCLFDQLKDMSVSTRDKLNALGAQEPLDSPDRVAALDAWFQSLETVVRTVACEDMSACQEPIKTQVCQDLTPKLVSSETHTGKKTETDGEIAEYESENATEQSREGSSSMIPDLLCGIQTTSVDGSPQNPHLPSIISDATEKTAAPKDNAKPLPKLPRDIRSIVKELLLAKLDVGMHMLMNSCNVDVLAEFLRQYFPYMDISKTVDVVFQCSKLDARRQLWKVLMEYLIAECYHDDTISSLLATPTTGQVLDGLHANLVPDRHLQMAVLLSEFPKSPNQILDYCASVSSVIPTVHVLYMCHEVKVKASKVKVTSQVVTSPEVKVKSPEVNFDDLKSRWHDHWLYYVQRYMALRAYLNRSCPLSVLCADPELYWASLDAVLLSGPNPDTLKCPCGDPRPSSHLSDWSRHNDLLQILLTWPDLDSDQSQRMLQRLYESGYWVGYLEKLIHWNKANSEIVLKMVLQLNDRRLLGQHCLYGYYPESAQHWTSLLKLKLQQCDSNSTFNCDTCTKLTLTCFKCQQPLQSTTCDSKCNIGLPNDQSDALEHSDQSELRIHKKCHNDDISDEFAITLDYLLSRMLEDLGFEEAANVIAEVDVPRSQLSSDFLDLCWILPVSDKVIRDSLHPLLEQIDSSVLSKDAPVIPPQLMKTVLMEAKYAKHHSNIPHKITELFSDDHLCKTTANSQWGAMIDHHSSCPVCGLSLLQGHSLTESGLDILACGHGLHSYCFRNLDHCPLCIATKPAS